MPDDSARGLLGSPSTLLPPPRAWSFWPSATPKTHPHKEAHSREIMCVGWPWVGVTVDPFVLQRGNKQPNRDPLSEHIGGSRSPSPNLPPQHAIPWTRCWDLSLRASRESQCHEEGYSLGLPSVPPAPISAAAQFCPTIL